MPFAPGAPGARVAERRAAYTVFTVPLDFEKIADWGKDARDVVRATDGAGSTGYVTGDLGSSPTSKEVFGSLDAKLLLAPPCCSC